MTKKTIFCMTIGIFALTQKVAHSQSQVPPPPPPAATPQIEPAEGYVYRPCQNCPPPEVYACPPGQPCQQAAGVMVVPPPPPVPNVVYPPPAPTVIYASPVPVVAYQPNTVLVQPMVFANDSAFRSANRMRKAGIAFTVIGLVGATFLIGGAIAYGAIPSCHNNNLSCIATVELGGVLTSLIIPGGILWGIGNARIERLRKQGMFSLAPTMGPAGMNGMTAGYTASF